MSIFNRTPGLNCVIVSTSTVMAPDVASFVSVLTWTGNCLKPVVKIAGDHFVGSI